MKKRADNSDQALLSNMCRLNKNISKNLRDHLVLLAFIVS